MAMRWHATPTAGDHFEPAAANGGSIQGLLTLLATFGSGDNLAMWQNMPRVGRMG